MAEGIRQAVKLLWIFRIPAASKHPVLQEKASRKEQTSHSLPLQTGVGTCDFCSEDFLKAEGCTGHFNYGSGTMSGV